MMVRVFACVILCCWLGIGLAEAQSRQPQQRDAAHEQREAQDNRGTTEQPLVVDIAPAPDAAERANEERQQRQREAINDGRQLALTVLIAFFTAAQVVMAAAAVFTTYKQLRAYVLVVESRIFGLDKGGDAEVVYKLKNTGQTPALNVGVEAGYAFEDPNHDDFELEGPHKTGGGLIGPGEHMTFRFIIPREDFVANQPALVAAKKTLFVFGEYWYRNVFGFTRRGKFRVCLVVDQGKAIEQLGTCNEGNEAN